MGTKGNTGIPGSIGPKGFKGENGIGTKGEKGDAANMDPRQRANWKQCAWKRTDYADIGKIQVSHPPLQPIYFLGLKHAVYEEIKLL